MNLFISVVTNWIYAGMSGARVGLNYQSVESALRMTNVPRSKWPEVFADIRVMEDAALAQMRENQKDDQ